MSGTSVGELHSACTVPTERYHISKELNIGDHLRPHQCGKSKEISNRCDATRLTFLAISLRRFIDSMVEDNPEEVWPPPYTRAKRIRLPRFVISLNLLTIFDSQISTA
jgi:hypothetical protein